MRDQLKHLLNVLRWTTDNVHAGFNGLSVGDNFEVQACLVAILDDCERALSLHDELVQELINEDA